MLELLFLLYSAWITSLAAAPLDLNNVYEVPEIEECAYVDAYYASCWWKRQEGDVAAQYRLGYTKAADALHERRERYCEVIEQSVLDGVVTESCKIRSSMYQSFTFWLASVENCDVTTQSCEALSRSSKLEFTATRQNVKLTIPPGYLNINYEGRRLTWQAPEKEFSMLSFVLHRRKVMYRVEYREIDERTGSDWQILYKGYERGIFLPALVPGATYEFRVFGSLDPPSSIFPTSTKSPENTDREWTESSNVLVFAVPKAMRVISEETIIKVEEEVPIPDETTSPEIVVDVIRRDTSSKKVIIASVVTAFIIVLVLAVLGYFLPWQRWCCCVADEKFAKPGLFLDFKEAQDDESSNTDSIFDKMDSNPGKEQVCAISEVPDYKPEVTVFNKPARNKLILGLQRNDTKESDYGRQRPFSPSTNLDETLSLNEILDHVDNSVDDVTNDVIEDNRKINNDGKIFLKNSGRVSEDGSVRYVKFGHGSQDSEFPSYLLTSEGSERMTLASLDRSVSEYVIDDTGIESTFLNDISDVTDMTSADDYTDEKTKQWQKYMLSVGKSHISDGDSDDVPDYVMHAPSFTKEFSHDLTMFISMVTEDITQRSLVNVYDETKEPLLHYDDKEEYLRIAGDPPSSLVIMKMCPSRKTGQKCPNRQVKAKNEMALPLPMTHDRRGSMSEHSIDSGYSPDSPDCVVLTSSNKDTLLAPRFQMGGSVADSDSDSGSDKEDYITYVTT